MLDAMKNALLFGLLLLSPAIWYAVWRLGRAIGADLMRRWTV